MLETFFEYIPYWLGLIAAILMWWIFKYSRPVVILIIKTFSNRFLKTKKNILSTIDKQYRKDILKYIQENHLASPLFSFSEIAIEPRLVTPPKPILPDAPPQDDIDYSVFPFLPDWPEVTAKFGLKTLSLAEALSSKHNLAIFGKPGMGKSFALNFLCAKLAQRDPSMGELSNCIPILVQVNDLDLTLKNEDPLNIIYQALSEKVSILLDAQLLKYLKTIVKNKTGLLLVDGLDELTTNSQKPIIEFLSSLRTTYPNLQIVMSLSTSDLSAADSLDFIPIALAAWTIDQKHEFLTKWGERWSEFILEEPWAKELPNIQDPIILNNWLMKDKKFLNPFELTLKTWAMYAGDAKGSKIEHAIDAYLNRMLKNIRNPIPKIEKIALQMLASTSPTISRKLELNIKSKETEMGIQNILPTQDVRDEIEIMESLPTLLKILPKLIECKIMKPQGKDLISFTHPIIFGYLAASHLAKYSNNNFIALDSNWAIYGEVIRFLALKSDINKEISLILKEDISNPLHFRFQKIQHWVLQTELSPELLNTLMRRVVDQITDEKLPLGIRIRVMAALSFSGQKGASELFRKLMRTKNPSYQLIGALGSGMIQDSNAIPDIENLFNSKNITCIRAASMALVAIGCDKSLELLTDTLKDSHESCRRAVAEALANHPRIGHEILKKGISMDDFSIRRASVYGVCRINDQWAKDALSEIQLNEDDWAVRNIIEDTLDDELKGVLFSAPSKDISDLGWLLNFAGEHGMGISPGRAGWDMLALVLKEGNEEQILGALEILKTNPSKANLLVSDLLNIVKTYDGEVKEAAYSTLWQLHAMAGDIF